MQVVLGKKRKYFLMKKVLTFFIKVCYNISAYFGYSSQPRETILGFVCVCVCVCVCPSRADSLPLEVALRRATPRLNNHHNTPNALYAQVGRQDFSENLFLKKVIE